MGMTFACSLDDLDSRLVRSASFGGDNPRIAPSVGFNIGDSKLKAFGSANMILEGSLSFKRRELEAKISVQAPEERASISLTSNNKLHVLKKPQPYSDNCRHLAAVKLQKTYKSFRTRRKLADCAVLVEQRWWKLLDFAELKRSSVSFFDIEKPETAISRWSRARTKAAKVGKGLSIADNARKLALQHWLEAIDPRHRYGHNLQFYYINWLHCHSKQPFFYWLDIGEGREVNIERCHRSNLQQQCIKYLGPMERRAYEVVISNGKLMYKESGKILDTREGPEDVKWIFVLGVSKILYVGQKKKGTFQHSSFLAGGATLSAGRLVVEDGVLKAVWPYSGHYLPTEENFEEFMAFLTQNNVDLSVVQKSPSNELEVCVGLHSSISAPDLRYARDHNTKNENVKDSKQKHSKDDENIQPQISRWSRKLLGLHSSISAPDLRYARDHNTKNENVKDSKQKHSKDDENIQPQISRWSRKLQSKIALLQIPKRGEAVELFRTPKPGSPYPLESPLDDGYETADEYLSDSEFSLSKHNLFDQDIEEEEYEKHYLQEKIIKRINSHKGMNSYQLANQLSCRWTTGAGPRIGCVRDYPSELQLRVLEEVSLSPRSAFSSPRISARGGILTPTNTTACRKKSPLSIEST